MSEPLRQVRVTLDSPGERLDRALAAAVPEVLALSRSRLQALIGEGAVAAWDGTVLADPRLRLAPGTEVVLTLPAPRPIRTLPEAIPLAIVFEDPHLIVVDKPAGLVVHPAPGASDGTLVNAEIARQGLGTPLYIAPNGRFLPPENKDDDGRQSDQRHGAQQHGDWHQRILHSAEQDKDRRDHHGPRHPGGKGEKGVDQGLAEILQHGLPVPGGCRDGEEEVEDVQGAFSHERRDVKELQQRHPQQQHGGSHRDGHRDKGPAAALRQAG